MSATTVMPAEWALQSAIMLTWPHKDTDWSEILSDVEPVFMNIARATLRFQHLIISCEDNVQLERVTRELDEYVSTQQLTTRVIAICAPANDTWARDHGPLSVIGPDGLNLLDFQFNAWGGKFPWEKDNALNQHLSEAGAFGRVPLRTVDFVLEGGSLESDGAGTFLVTSECLLTPSRNPSFDRTGIEKVLAETLGAERVLWLNHGYLAGDDTDSHIDTLARFCAQDHIAYVACDRSDDEHYAALCAMKEELEQFRQPDGQPYKLTALPWPDAVFDDEGERLPATYANFLIINDAVLLPVYNVAQDQAAIEIMKSIFPDREIIAIECAALIRQHGSLHCVTMQLPEGVVEL